MAKRVGHVLRRGIATTWRLWTSLTQAILGTWEWRAPPWYSRAAATVATRRDAALALARRRPRATAYALLTALALLVGTGTLIEWYRHLPKPEFASISVTAPERTRLEVENAKPDPLTVRFDRSAASLALAGKELPTGVELQPALAGTWRWLDDRVLEFRPRDDWPIGQRFTVTLDPAITAPQVRLATRRFEFASASFAAHLAGAQFYQDPVTPGNKFGVFDIEFTHPVNPAELERRVEVRLAGQKEGILGVGREAVPYTVVYDKLKLHASIHSASLPIPKNPTTLEVTAGAGIHAARGGNATESPVTGVAAVPGLYSLAVEGVQPVVVNNARNEPEQVLLLNLSAATGERDIGQATRAWILPPIHPATAIAPAQGSEASPYRWYDPREVTEEALRQARALTLEQIPAEREFSETHSFRYHADVGRSVLIEVDKNLRSFGGYLSARTERFIVQVPPFPPELKILSQGALLALSGEHKVAALVRDLPGVRIDIARVLPGQLQHIVSQSAGDFAHPAFYGSFGADNVTERFVRKVPLTDLPHGQAHYETIDFTEYLKGDGAEKRGLFLLTVSDYDPKVDAARARRRREAAREDAAAEPQIAAHHDDAANPRVAADRNGDSDQNGNDPGNGYGSRGGSDTAYDAGNGYGSRGGDDTAYDAGPGSRLRDQRLVLVTDLGIVLKRSTDGTQDVFVQSIVGGLPVVGATVDIIAKNGTTLVTQSTDAQGRAHFAKLDGMNLERTPLLVQVRKAGDMSFLPLDHPDRALDFSRFDIGGIRNARAATALTAYVFSDRGIYRPGDTLHVGLITKTANWSKDLAGVPLEAEILDPRGLTVHRERFKLPAGGFVELTHALPDTAPTGAYVVNLYIVKDGEPGAEIGTTTVRVQEFEPDRMKIAAHLSAENVDGWVSPEGLHATVNVANLFGTPAENRRVQTTLTLTPAFPAFRNLSDYRFYDPLRAKEGYNDTLPEARTDANGNATIDLGLQKYAKATYRVHVLTRAFEPAGGRSVTADAAVLVSDMPFLIGFKTDGDLDYVSRDSKRALAWIAIAPNAKPMAASGLTLKRIEIKYVSVLAKQPNGTYQYESRKKELTLAEEPFAVSAAGLEQSLATDVPGTFAYVIRDASGLELNRVEYSVVGQANLTRSLERNAELQIQLDKTDYAPGEDIELSIKAPYVGAGLITIERDHVFATQWFKTDTTASVQKIRLPADFEGNGYVTVQFIRDPASDEIFSSPLSYGVVPFATSLAARTNPLTLTVPELVKPGEPLHMQLQATHATRAVVFAVDEGILQVAHYQTPNPLGEFFKKRALEVRTAQILDLILPEFKRVLAAAAPGGDGEAALRRNLNPFKRKHDKPAVYWSGIVDVAATREFTWTVPDTFNGSLKVFAVAVNDNAIGVAQTQTTVRGDFVLTPNMPVAVAPGDEFDVSVGVANGVAGSGNAAVVVNAELPPQLEAIGPAQQTLKIAERGEAVALFRLRARAMLGDAPVRFTAAWQGHGAHLVSDVSVRPASPYVTDILAGYFGSAVDVPIQRSLFPNLRKLNVGVSNVPLVLADGLADYLDSYPHLCTEQLVSRGFPALVFAHRPELARDDGEKTPVSATKATPASLPAAAAAAGTSQTTTLTASTTSAMSAKTSVGMPAASTTSAASVKNSAAAPSALERQAAAAARATVALVEVLRSRQNAEGGFGLWAASTVADDFASVYALQWLIDAREQGLPIPTDLYSKGLVWLQRYAASAVPDNDPEGLAGLRNRAYAAYLLTRTGMVITPIVSSLRETLDARHAKIWRDDITAAYLAAVYRMQHQDREAAALMDRAAAVMGRPGAAPFDYYYDDTVRDARLLYLLSRHFPERARALEPRTLQSMVAPLTRGQYNTHSAAALLMAFDAYASTVPADALGNFSASESAAGKSAPLALEGRLILRGVYGGDSSRLHVDNATGMSGFYAVTNAGFDRTPPTTELRQGIEILREYLDAKGQPVSTVDSGAEVTVRLRLRAIDREFIRNVAVIDLLPGGFEPVLQSAAAGGGEDSARDGNDGAAGGDAGEAAANGDATNGDASANGRAAGAWFDRLGGGGSWRPEFADIREDRVVLYGTLGKDMAEYTYKIRATNAGVFVVPPSYVESMYDRSLRARASQSRITVVQPAGH